MALVAYDYSDSENEEQDEDENTSSSCVIVNDKPQKATQSSDNSISTEQNGTNTQLDNTEQNNEISSTTSMFSVLPDSKITPVNEVEEDKLEDFIPKSKPIVKEKQKVKITIPSLSQFETNDDDDEPQHKKVKPSSKGSGLLSLLPPVKGSPMTAKSFVPNSVAKKTNKTAPKPAATTKSLIPNAVRKTTEAATKKPKPTKPSNSSDIESDDDIEMPETFDDEMWQKVCGRPKPKEIIREPEETPPQEIINIAPEPVQPYEGLDNTAFKELIGKSKRPIGNIKLIDINEEEILPEKDLWMTKSLTDPECVPKPVVEDPVDPTRRKKHHITYLAQQAKANEQELQTQWSASKHSRTQTRAKYGF